MSISRNAQLAEQNRLFSEENRRLKWAIQISLAELNDPTNVVSASVENAVKILKVALGDRS